MVSALFQSNLQCLHGFGDVLGGGFVDSLGPRRARCVTKIKLPRTIEQQQAKFKKAKEAHAESDEVLCGIRSIVYIDLAVVRVHVLRSCCGTSEFLNGVFFENLRVCASQKYGSISGLFRNTTCLGRILFWVYTSFEDVKKRRCCTPSQKRDRHQLYTHNRGCYGGFKKSWHSSVQ